MSTTCVCEAHIYEYEVARRWYALPAGVLLPLNNADCCQLLFAGHPGSAAGPDVQDAVLHFAQHHTHSVGDVEFHVRASDWYTHQHHRDARYNNVFLHVVLICDTSAPILRQDGTVIPLCSLYDLPLPHRPISQTSWPCHDVLPYMSDEERLSLFTQAGILRFEQKAHTFVEQLHTAHPHAPFSAYDVCLIVALAEGLGYGRNRAFFRATGQYLLGLLDIVPEPLGHTFDPPYLDASRLSILRKLIEQWRTRSAWTMIREILLNSAGIMPKGRGPRRGGGPCGRPLGGEEQIGSQHPEDGGRPQGPPLHIHTTPAPTRLPSHGEMNTYHPINQLRAIFTGLGIARSDILICNIVLPFALAVGLIENDNTLATQAQSLYQTYPSLSSNRITRAMSTQLQLPDEPTGACQQQGLHYIYQQTCKEKRCDECIVGRRKL